MPPARERTTPEMVRLSVDLPTPLEPRTETISPALTSRLTPRNTSPSPYPANTSRTSRSFSEGIRAPEFGSGAVAEVSLNHPLVGRDLRRTALRDDAAFRQ